MKQIELIGLLWDAENLEAYGYSHFNWESAMQLAKDKWKRIPINEEWIALSKLPNIWDEKLKGRWFAEKEKYFFDFEKSLFLPAAGYRTANNGAFSNVGTFGNYWSATTASSVAFYLNFNSGRVSPALQLSRALGFSVRCVSV